MSEASNICAYQGCNKIIDNEHDYNFRNMIPTTIVPFEGVNILLKSGQIQVNPNDFCSESCYNKALTDQIIGIYSRELINKEAQKKYLKNGKEKIEQNELKLKQLNEFRKTLD